MNDLVKKAFEASEIHIIHAEGLGYTLYCVDLHGCNRFFIEVYEEPGEAIVYHQGKVYNYQDVDEETWSRLDQVHGREYKLKQYALGKSWQVVDEELGY